MKIIILEQVRNVATIHMFLNNNHFLLFLSLILHKMNERMAEKRSQQVDEEPYSQIEIKIFGQVDFIICITSSK